MEEAATNQHYAYMLSTDDAHTWADGISVRHDLEETRDILVCLNKLQQSPNTIANQAVIQKALFSCALVKYRRCFNGGQRHSFMLTKENVASFGGDSAEFHQYLYHLADKYAAHSVNAYEQTIPCARVLNGVIDAKCFTVRLDHLGPEHIEKWIVLIQFLEESIVTPRVTAAQDAVNAYVLSKTEEEIRRLPVLDQLTLDPKEAGERRARRYHRDRSKSR